MAEVVEVRSYIGDSRVHSGTEEGTLNIYSESGIFLGFNGSSFLLVRTEAVKG